MRFLTPRAWSCSLLSLAIFIGPCQAQGGNQTETTTAAAQGQAGSPATILADLLIGIAQYTRWPGDASSVQVCIDDRDAPTALAVERRLAEGASTSRRDFTLASRRLNSDSAQGLLDCQVVYFEDAGATLRPALLIALANRPILTIGHGEDFCSYGGLFCLTSAPTGWRIQANLDAIARSGLRVNPQLLRLTQRDGLTR
jgi:hypothetical protein